MRGCVCVSVCVSVRTVNPLFLVKWPMGGGGGTYEEALDKRESWLNKERVKKAEALSLSSLLPSRKEEESLHPSSASWKSEGLPASVPWVILSLSLNAMLIHFLVLLSHAAIKLCKPQTQAVLASLQRL